MTLNEGWRRLGVAVTAAWAAVVLGWVIYEYLLVAEYCEQPTGTIDRTSFVYAQAESWVPDTLAIVTCSPQVQFGKVLVVLLGPPLVAWCTGFLAAWVRAGFKRGSASEHTKSHSADRD
jgi:hypothetical protein